MQMDTQTQQFAFRTFIITVCGLIVAMALYMFAVGILQGDGEAVRIIDVLYPIMRDTLAALVLMITGQQVGHIVNNVMTAKAASNAVTPPTAPAPVQS